MFCKYCGNELQDDAIVCMKCGCPVAEQKKSEYVEKKNEKNHTVAGFLAIFLGGLGVHKFYLGHVGLGLLFLLFCWTGIPSIVGFVEGILYLECPQEQFTEKYSYLKKEKK